MGPPEGDSPTGTAAKVDRALRRPAHSQAQGVLVSFLLSVLLVPALPDWSPTYLLLNWLGEQRLTYGHRLVVCACLLGGFLWPTDTASKALVVRGSLILAALIAVRCDTLYEAVGIVPWLVLAGALTASPDSRWTIAVICASLMILLLVTAAVVYISDYKQFYTPGLGRRASGLWETPNLLYPIACVASIVFWCAFLQAPAGARRLGSIAATLLAAGLLLLTFSRAGWLGFAAAGAYLLRGKHWSLAAGFAIILLVASAVSRPFTAGSGFDRSATGRLEIWDITLDVAARSPIVGHGPEAFERLVQPILVERRPASRYLPSEPKNLPLGILLAQGAIGAAIVTACLVAFAGWGWRSRNVSGWDVDTVLASSLMPVTIAVLVMGLFDAFAWVAAERLPVSCFISAVLGIAGAASIATTAGSPNASSLSQKRRNGRG